ncbi:MAG: ATP synthase F1 subunit delta [Planctomycetota bacterium]|jgi:F-type H+-transporting ATPase subunit delta
MASARLVLHRYAHALHALAHEAGVAEQVGQDLATLTRDIAAHEGLAARLASPRLTREQKRSLFAALLQQGRHDLVRRTVNLLVDKGRASAVSGLAAVYEEVLMAASGRIVAKVTSATALDDELRTRLVAELTALSGKQVTLEETLDEGLLGGLRIVLGSRMIDGSLSHRLDALRQRLMAAPLGSVAG